MKVNVRADSVEISGYVNAVERNSKPLMSRIGQFIERICKGAFKRAITRNNDIHILLNHDWNRDLGSTKAGNLELQEDNIGLFARATIDDPDVVQKARNGDLVGWSFGFSDRDVQNSLENGIPTRAVKDLDLYEVSILDRTKSPAYEGTLITSRAETNEIHFRGDDFIDEVNVSIEEEKALKIENEQPQEEQNNNIRLEQQEVVENKNNQEIDYTKYENIIKEMKGE
jgi:HK97 family phage prohead protease